MGSVARCEEGCVEGVREDEATARSQAQLSYFHGSRRRRSIPEVYPGRSTVIPAVDLDDSAGATITVYVDCRGLNIVLKLRVEAMRVKYNHRLHEHGSPSVCTLSHLKGEELGPAVHVMVRLGIPADGVIVPNRVGGRVKPITQGGPSHDGVATDIPASSSFAIKSGGAC